MRMDDIWEHLAPKCVAARQSGTPGLIHGLTEHRSLVRTHAVLRFHTAETRVPDTTARSRQRKLKWETAGNAHTENKESLRKPASPWAFDGFRGSSQVLREAWSHG